MLEQQQWLGFEINQRKLALPLSAVASAFYSVLLKTPAKPFGLEVHEGVPVFLLSPAELFGVELKTLENESEPSSWVIVLKSNEDADIGFRVQKTIGPFHAVINLENQIHYLDQVLDVVSLLESTHD